MNKKYAILSIKLIIISLSFGFVGYKLIHSISIGEVFLFIKNIRRIYFVLLILVIIGVFINWILESLKWKILISAIQQISFFKALSAILAGITITMFTPNRTGEFAGRVMVLDSKNRIDGIVATIVGSLSQLIITIFIGVIAISLMGKGNQIQLPEARVSWKVVRIVFAIMVVLFIVLFFNLKSLIRKFSNTRLFQKIRQYFQFIKKYSMWDLSRVLLLSAARYIVFIVQIYLLFMVFELDIDFYECFLGAGLMYFIMAVIPAFTIAELGIRGSIAILVFEQFSSNIFGIVSATSLLWIFNLAIPALIGSIVFYKMKI